MSDPTTAQEEAQADAMLDGQIDDHYTQPIEPYNNGDGCQHLAIRDGDRIVCTHCEEPLFLRPRITPRPRAWALPDVTVFDQERGL